MLIDTDVLIWYMRGHKDAARFLGRLDAFAISAVTYMELVQGMRNKQELLVLRRALHGWDTPVLPITEAITGRAIGYVEEYFLSNSLRLPDALIAATAIEHGLPLASANLKHYKVLSDLVLEKFTPS